MSHSESVWLATSRSPVRPLGQSSVRSFLYRHLWKFPTSSTITARNNRILLLEPSRGPMTGGSVNYMGLVSQLNESLGMREQIIKAMK
jgi:hypothetical protein